MNSSQRRKARREHPHHITIDSRSVRAYYEHDQKIIKARKWCNKHCKQSWRVEEAWDCTVFKFFSEKEAVYFALKWL